MLNNSILLCLSSSHESILLPQTLVAEAAFLHPDTGQHDRAVYTGSNTCVLHFRWNVVLSTGYLLLQYRLLDKCASKK